MSNDQAVLLLVLGLVLQNQANFAKSYVHDQLAAQKISFTPVKGLSDEEKQADCLVANAGKELTTGKQAECYANEYIGLHVKSINDGKTDALFRGESLRGLLLTSYGFSVFGERAAQAAIVAFLAAAVLALASIAGFVHAFSKAGEHVIE